jgi:hypothetical protein
VDGGGGTVDPARGDEQQRGKTPEKREGDKKVANDTPENPLRRFGRDCLRDFSVTIRGDRFP